MADDPILYADRDQVIRYAKDWLYMLAEAQKWAHFKSDTYGDLIERQDVMNACLDLAYNRAKEALVAYAKHREKLFAKHDEMLDTIEELLQEKVKDIKDGGEKD